MVKYSWLDLIIMVGFNNLEWMKQRFCVMKMTLTFRAGSRDPLGLKNEIESLCSFWFKSVVIWVLSSDLVDHLGLILLRNMFEIRYIHSNVWGSTLWKQIGIVLYQNSSPLWIRFAWILYSKSPFITMNQLFCIMTYAVFCNLIWG